MGDRKRILEATTVVAVAVAAIVATVLQPAYAYPRPGTNIRVVEPLVDSPASEGSGASSSLSATGRYVAFASRNDFLVTPDSNPAGSTGIVGSDVFVYDRIRDELEFISVSSEGVQGLGASETPSISSDGRYVAFISDASNLVAGDTNLVADAFVHDHKFSSTERVSVASEGAEAGARAGSVSISSNGRFVAFDSTASNLVAGDANNTTDVFVRDRRRHRTVRVSMSSQREEGNNASTCTSISGNGRHVAFSSNASNLVDGDLNQATDVFVHDLDSGTTERVSVASDGTEGRGPTNSSSRSCSTDGHAISSNGRLVAFDSFASNLVPNDARLGMITDPDVFVHDRWTGRTELLSVTSYGEEPSGGSDAESMSRDGRYITFDSSADDLFCCDTTESTLPVDTLCGTAGFCPEPPSLNGDFDVFIHDRRVGSTEVVSIGHEGTEAADCGPLYATSSKSDDSSVSDDGRYVSFLGCAANLVENDVREYTGRRDFDIYLRDRGRDLGVGGPGGSSGEEAPNEDRICVAPSLCIPPGGVAVFTDNLDDVDGPATERGANLIGGRVAFRRPLVKDIYVTLELEHMPRTPALATLTAGIVYGMSFDVNGKAYEIRAASTGLGFQGETTALFGLFSCSDPVHLCSKVADLRGGFGTSGERITLSIPLGELGITDGAAISDVRAFTALGVYDQPLQIQDHQILDRAVLDGRR